MIDTAFASALLKGRVDEELHRFLALLMKRTREGHLCIYEPQMKDRLGHLIEGEKSPIVCYQDHYYLRRSFELETMILYHLKRLHEATPRFSFIPFAKTPLYDTQKEALEKAFSNRVLLISGGPGTGKTYLAKALIEAMLSQKKDASILFTAPTGKAAFRMKQAGITQGTLHNVLGLREKMNNSFEAKPLIYDLIIADECSMIDAKLFSFFLSSIPSGTQLVLMGDPDQLPPVEAGFVFPDFFNIPNFPKVHLNQSMRSDRKGILTLARHIKENQIESVLSLLKNQDFPDINLVPFPKEPPIPIDTSITFLTPFRKGYFSSTYCNHYIEEHKKTSLKTPLIVTKNDYKFELMNGDMGIKEDSYGLFPKKVPLALISEYDLAWTISVHKSQGSEFKHIIVFLPTGSEAFGKELLYTAITRAKETVTIASSEETLKKVLSETSRPLSNIASRWK